MQQREQIGRRGTFVTYQMPLPILWITDARIRQRGVCLLTTLPNQRDRDQRQPWVGTALQQHRGILGGNVNFAGCQQLQVLALAG